jgi:hypothetical protein
MPERQEHQPGTDAPVTGLYEELNVFGSPTGKVSMCMRASDCRTRHGASVGERSRRRAARGAGEACQLRLP